MAGFGELSRHHSPDPTSFSPKLGYGGGRGV